MDDCNRALKIEPVNTLGLAVRGLCKWRASDDADQALLDIDAALKISPQSATAFFFKGHILTSIRRHSEAIECFTRAVQIHPLKAEYYVHRADAFRSLCKYDSALADCDQAIMLAPNNCSAWAQRAVTRCHANQMSDAYSDCHKAMELEPSSYLAIATMAHILSIDNKHEDALLIWNQVGRLGSDKYQFHCTKAALLVSLHRFYDAIEQCDIAQSYRNTWVVHVNRAYAKLCLKLFDECNADLVAAESLDANELFVVSNRARWLVATGNPKEALERLQSLSQANDSYNYVPAVLCTHGLVCKALEQYDSALQWFERALKLNANHMESLWHHGDVLEKMETSPSSPSSLNSGLGTKEKATAIEKNFLPNIFC